MDFLNKALAQANELFRSMTPGARITAGLLLVLVVVSLAYLFRGNVAGPDVFLMNGHPFPSTELPKAIAALGQAGLSDFEVENNMIRIPRGKQAAYIAALADGNALPTGFGEFLLRTIKDTGPFTTSEERDELMKVAKQQVLADTIHKMSGIEAATVLFDTQNRRGLRGDAVATAMVSVQPTGSLPLDEERVRSIRNLVAGAIAGLLPRQVTVVDRSTGKSWSGDSSDGGSATDDAYFTRMRAYQDQYKREILDMLSLVRGATVSVNVELDPHRIRRESDVKVDPKAVATSIRENTSSSLTESAGPAGRPGFAAQGPNRPAGLAGGAATPTTRSQDETSDTETQNVVSHTSGQTEIVGLTPRRVTVSIGIPSRYLEELWRRQNPTPAGEEPKQPTDADLATIFQEESVRIRSAVANVVPQDNTLPLEQMVAVNRFISLTDPPLAVPGFSDQALAWLSNYWTTIGTFGLAGFSLLMLRSMVRSAPAAEPMPAEVNLPDETNDEAPKPAPPIIKRRLESGPSLQDELGEMVRENPDAAANILRSWIGNVN
ncbi:MAG: hypothetical protein KF708_17965 [Pirellulales bacterium]|nr:hypothetical protein [Pirellulales bacterium]